MAIGDGAIGTVNGVFLSPPAAADQIAAEAAFAAKLYQDLDAAFARVGDLVKIANDRGYWVNPNQYNDPTGKICYALKLTRDVPRT